MLFAQRLYVGVNKSSRGERDWKGWPKASPSNLPSGVFLPSYATNSAARGLHLLGFPWAYAEVTKLVLKMSSSILFFAQFERSYY